MNDDVKAALAEALDIEVEDLYRMPGRPNGNEIIRLLEDVTDEQRSQIRGYIEGLISKRSSK